MEKPSILKSLFRGVVLLIALGILATYVRHTQHEADVIREELAEVKALLLQQVTQAEEKPTSNFQPTSGLTLSESHSWQPDSRPVPLRPKPLANITGQTISSLISRTPVFHTSAMMASSKSGKVFQSFLINPPSAPDTLNLTEAKAETINPVYAATRRLMSHQFAPFIASSKSAVIKPSYTVSAWQWLFDLKPRKAEPSASGPLTRTEAGLTQEDLEKLSKPASPMIQNLIEPSPPTSPQMFDSSKSGRIFSPYSLQHIER
jgi:hypothetical protein